MTDSLAPWHVVGRTFDPATKGRNPRKVRIDVIHIDAEQHPGRHTFLDAGIGDQSQVGISNAQPRKNVAPSSGIRPVSFAPSSAV